MNFLLWLSSSFVPEIGGPREGTCLVGRMMIEDAPFRVGREIGAEIER
jgi:hypothetical protein